MVAKQGHVTAYAVVLMVVIALSQQSEPKNNTGEIIIQITNHITGSRA